MESRQLYALVELGRLLKAANYRFTTITPDSHRRLTRRKPGWIAESAHDVFGWSRPFNGALLPAEWMALLEAADALIAENGLYRSRIRFSSVGEDLFVHSSYPTLESDSVFFGPDTYRFARLIKSSLGTPGRDAPVVADIGAGSGAGGLYAWRLLGCGAKLILGDISPKALDFARANARIAGCEDASFMLGDLFAGLGQADIILSNPPYLLDAGSRVYRHGGGRLGFELSMRIVNEGIPKLNPGGVLILYTGSVIVDGEDAFCNAIAPALSQKGLTHSYEELDPDVFGEELDNPAYGAAERVAAVGLVVRKES